MLGFWGFDMRFLGSRYWAVGLAVTVLVHLEGHEDFVSWRILRIIIGVTIHMGYGGY